MEGHRKVRVSVHEYVCNPKPGAATMDTPSTPPATLKEMLMKHFAPAKDSDPGKNLKSTSDLFRIVDEHAPGKFELEDMYDVLTALGFVDKLVGDTIMWAVQANAIRS